MTLTSRREPAYDSIAKTGDAMGGADEAQGLCGDDRCQLPHRTGEPRPHCGCPPESDETVRKDPIVEQVRKVRQRHAAKFNYDLDAICRDLKEQERKSGRKVVSLLPKRPSRWAKTG